MKNKLGIDAGGSLIKVAYEEKENLHTKIFPIEQVDQLLGWLHFLSPDSMLYLTGGKSSLIQDRANQAIQKIDEFQALTAGTRFLLKREKEILSQPFILVSIGTGTSIFYVEADHYERLLGTGIGGGTFMGLGNIITGGSSFQELTEIAASGNHENSDLLINDIYAPDAPPLDGKLTASNFGKAAFNRKASMEDHLAAVINLIGETIILLAGHAASTKQVDKIVFIGSTLNGNVPLKQRLSNFQQMFPYTPLFLDKGAFAGAIGTLLV